MEQIIVDGKPREDRGKNAARRMRQKGEVPAVLYGGKGGPLALTVNTKQFSTLLRSEAGQNTVFHVRLPNGDQPAMVKDWQVDPVKCSLLPVDMLRVAMDVRIRVRVPVHTFGEAQGVKLQGGVFETVTREVEIECLPTEIPGEFRVDITDFMIGRQLRAGDLPMDAEKMKLVTDPQRVIAHVVALRVEEEKPAEAVAAEAATPAEPEVIKKGKKEEEGEEGAVAEEKAEKPEKSKK
jgi:large subunit ribosomal protein L25